MSGAALLPAMLLLLAGPETGKLRESVKADEARLRDSPDDADALKRLGMAYLSLEEPDKAVPPFRELVRRRPGPESSLLLVRALRLAGEEAEAKSLLDQDITQSQSDSALHMERALLARALGENEARSGVDPGDRAQPRDPPHGSTRRVLVAPAPDDAIAADRKAWS
jgi:tetratricopeptide (TPR) repeat protein